MTVPAIPDIVSEALCRYPETVRTRILEIRLLIFSVAAEIGDIGPLTETLKWGEAAYLTEVSRSGSTIRLGTVSRAPQAGAILFNCRTRLVEMFRSEFPADFSFDGNRALIIPADHALPVGPVRSCLRTALTYHRQQGRQVWI